MFNPFLKSSQQGNVRFGIRKVLGLGAVSAVLGAFLMPLTSTTVEASGGQATVTYHYVTTDELTIAEKELIQSNLPSTVTTDATYYLVYRPVPTKVATTTSAKALPQTGSTASVTTALAGTGLLIIAVAIGKRQKKIVRSMILLGGLGAAATVTSVSALTVQTLAQFSQSQILMVGSALPDGKLTIDGYDFVGYIDMNSVSNPVVSPNVDHKPLGNNGQDLSVSEVQTVETTEVMPKVELPSSPDTSFEMKPTDTPETPTPVPSVNNEDKEKELAEEVATNQAVEEEEVAEKLAEAAAREEANKLLAESEASTDGGVVNTDNPSGEVAAENTNEATNEVVSNSDTSVNETTEHTEETSTTQAADEEDVASALAEETARAEAEKILAELEAKRQAEEEAKRQAEEESSETATLQDSPYISDTVGVTFINKNGVSLSTLDGSGASFTMRTFDTKNQPITPEAVDRVVTDYSAQLDSSLSRIGELEFHVIFSKADGERFLTRTKWVVMGKMGDSLSDEELARLKTQLKEQVELSIKTNTIISSREGVYEVLLPDYSSEAARQSEVEANRQAEEEAKRQSEAEAKRQAEEETKRQAEEDANRQAEEEAKRQAEEEAKRQAEEEAKLQAEEEAKRQAEVNRFNSEVFNAFESQYFALRESQGLTTNPVVSPALMKFAQIRAQQIAEDFKHGYKDMTSRQLAGKYIEDEELRDRLAFEGYIENIIVTSDDDHVNSPDKLASYFISRWMTSQGHSANLNNAYLTDYAFAIFKKDGIVYGVFIGDIN